MSTQPPVPAEDDLPEQLRIRREKRAHLIERGVDPYPVAVARTHTLKEVREKYAALEISDDLLHRQQQLPLFQEDAFLELSYVYL